jgi:hypothetical protein
MITLSCYHDNVFMLSFRRKYGNESFRCNLSCTCRIETDYHLVNKCQLRIHRAVLLQNLQWHVQLSTTWQLVHITTYNRYIVNSITGHLIFFINAIKRMILYYWNVTQYSFQSVLPTRIILLRLRLQVKFMRLRHLAPTLSRDSLTKIC